MALKLAIVGAIIIALVLTIGFWACETYGWPGCVDKENFYDIGNSKSLCEFANGNWTVIQYGNDVTVVSCSVPENTDWEKTEERWYHSVYLPKLRGGI